MEQQTPQESAILFPFPTHIQSAAEVVMPKPKANAKSVPLSPLLQQVADLVGRRADDAAVAAFVTSTLGKKVPATTGRDMKHVVDRKRGLELGFGHDIHNDKYPLIHKTKSIFIPYLQLVWISEKFPEPLPFGLEFGMGVKDVEKAVGPATEMIGHAAARRPVWRRTLDAARDVELEVEAATSLTVRISVQEAAEFTSAGYPARAVVGLFLAWAVQRDLIESPRLAKHAALLNAVRQRKQQGSALLDAAFPRGLWDIDFKDEPGLREFLYLWFHNIDKKYIRDDLVKAFGAREGKYGHDEPILDDDDWAAVDQAAKVLDKRFAAWVNKAAR